MEDLKRFDTVVVLIGEHAYAGMVTFVELSEDEDGGPTKYSVYLTAVGMYLQHVKRDALKKLN
jgi:hypothetical protein